MNRSTSQGQHNHQPQIIHWLMLAGLALTWGSSYFFIKKSLLAFTPIQVAFLRIGLTSIVFAPILLIRWRKIDWSKWPILLLIGLLGSFLPFLLFPIAQTRIESSLAGILSSLTPLLTFFTGILIFRQAFKGAKLIGVILGMNGAAFLMWLQNGETGWSGLHYGSLILIACLCYALSSNLIKQHLYDTPSLTISAISFTLIGMPSIASFIFSEGSTEWLQHEQAGAAFTNVVLLAIFSTALASIVYFKLIKETSALFAASVSYLTPLVAVSWGLWDGEPIAAEHFVGMALILGGIYLTMDH